MKQSAMTNAYNAGVPFDYALKLNRADNQLLFLRGFGHTCRNPLNSIMLANELLKNYLDDITDCLVEPTDETSALTRQRGQHIQSNMQQVVHDISSSASRLNQLVRDLSEIIGRGSVASCNVINVRQLANVCPQILEYQIHERTNHFSFTIDDNIPLLSGNGQQLLQAMHNLLINALFALPDRSCAIRCNATWDQSAGELMLSFCDQGCGIEPELLPRVTEPFFTTWGHRGCMGLGLPVADRIIRGHGGKLHIDSKPGQGTTVRAVLPLPAVTETGTGSRT